MSGSQALPEGKPQKLLQRKRTMFTEKQVEALTLMFNRNPYPDPILKKEMASKMNIDPTVLQVWFKNHRAKLKKAKGNIQQKQAAQHQQFPEGAADASPPPRDVDTPPRSPDGAYPVALIYINNVIPSFQLSVWPTFKDPRDHSGGHKMVHFGCCQDPTIYCLHPLFETQDHFVGFNSLPVQRGERERS